MINTDSDPTQAETICVARRDVQTYTQQLKFIDYLNLPTHQRDRMLITHTRQIPTRTCPRHTSLHKLVYIELKGFAFV